MIQERDKFPGFRIPMVCVPASIDNNLPGSDLSIGADTALNNVVQTLDRIKQSASASKRCFVAETMGRKNGYLALMSAIATGAEQVYLYERGITLTQLADDTKRMIDAFEKGRKLYLVIRNEMASAYYTSDFIARIFEEEGGGLFDVRSSILGHMQQGGNPSPFDRTLAVRMVNSAIDVLCAELEKDGNRSWFIGQQDGKIQPFPLKHMTDYIDMEDRLPYSPWWMGLEDVLYVVADPNFQRPLRTLEILEN